MRKVIIVDDEAPARQLIKEYISAFSELIILGEANNGVDAIQLIEQFKPDLVFMDIQMPGMTGFDVLEHLRFTPNIIFSTAYDQYALKAFEVNAIDYLLKPYTKVRFEKAIKKVLESEDKNIRDLEQLTQHLLNNAPINQQTPKTILVQKGNKYVSIKTEDIVWIGAEKDYATITTNAGTFLSNFGIGALEKKLTSEYFLRIHRSTIINIRCVAEVFKNAASYDIRLNNGDNVRVSRSYMDVIKDITF